MLVLKYTHTTGISRLFVSLLLAFSLSASDLQAQSDIDYNHRDSFKMNSIGGGDFRMYITDHVSEEDNWAYAMRTFGIFHNLMHDMMTSLVRYDAHVNGSEIPEFTERISGGGWTDYRKMAEADDSVSEEWLHFVNVVEIMHDRVHHAMYKSVLYDLENNQRTAVIGDYAGEERAPYETEDTFPDLRGFSTAFISADDSRLLAWNSGIEGRYLHAAVQQMTRFSHMLRELTTLWAAESRGYTDESCRADGFETRISFDAFQSYTATAYWCGDDEWRNLMRAAGMMQVRIHQMMAAFTAYLNS